jgi:hypothetical protein
MFEWTFIFTLEFTDYTDLNDSVEPERQIRELNSRLRILLRGKGYEFCFLGSFSEQGRERLDA